MFVLDTLVFKIYFVVYVDVIIATDHVHIIGLPSCSLTSAIRPLTLSHRANWVRLFGVMPVTTGGLLTPNRRLLRLIQRSIITNKGLSPWFRFFHRESSSLVTITHIEASCNFSPIWHIDSDGCPCTAESRVKITCGILALTVNLVAVECPLSYALTCMEVFMADVAVLVTPTIAVDIMETVNCLTSTNSGQDTHIAALVRPTTSLRQLLLHLAILTCSELHTYGWGI